MIRANKEKYNLYAISADNGNSWSEQWLRKGEAWELANKYRLIVKDVKSEFYVIPDGIGEV